jgi:hypothetical protein
MERRKKSRTVGQQGLEHDDGHNEISAPQPIEGLGPAGQILSLSGGGGSSLLSREPEPRFSGGAPPPGGASDSTLLGPDPSPGDGNFKNFIDSQSSAQTSPLLLEGSVGTETGQIERGVLSCGRPPDFLPPEQIAHCAIDDPESNAPVHQTVKGLDPNDPSFCPAAEQTQTSLEEEANDPFAEFRAWRRMVASYALKIRTEGLPALVDELLGRLRDGETQSPVTREEVVSSLTRTITGGTAPKKRVEGQKRTHPYKGRTNHAARRHTMYAR